PSGTAAVTVGAGRAAVSRGLHSREREDGARGRLGEPPPAAPGHQKRNFAPSSMRRMPPADVIRPKSAAPNVVLGLPQLTVLNRLKISARSCRRARPPTNTFFISERLVTFEPGPLMRLRGALPNVYWSGSENAEGS